MLTDNYMSYDQYLDCADKEEREVIDKLFEQCILDIKDLNKIMKIKEKINILVITSTKCKDSATIVPFLLKIKEINNNIEVNFLLKNENEELLKELSGESRVPSFLILDQENNVLRKFVEFPIGVKEILSSSPVEETQDIVDSMRSGLYNKLIQDDIIKFITGEGYEYYPFERKDK